MAGQAQAKLNAVYSSPTMKRRYEVWFLRCGLADGSGAWWFRYLTMNLGRAGCGSESTKMPAQVWATWFPRNGEPQSYIQGFPLEELSLSPRGELPFHCNIAENGIDENQCWGALRVDGHEISWKLRNRSNFGVKLSDKGWIGFSRSPHSDAEFSGEIVLDGKRLAGEPLGFGVQGHNCGYRHRTFWRWMHAYFPASEEQGATPTTLEALVYDLPLGMTFRNAVLWHEGRGCELRGVREREIVKEAGRLRWSFIGRSGDGQAVEATLEGALPGIHRLPYEKTDCTGNFPVSNASVARATVRIGKKLLETETGGVLEMGGA